VHSFKWKSIIRVKKVSFLPQKSWASKSFARLHLCGKIEFIVMQILKCVDEIQAQGGRNGQQLVTEPRGALTQAQQGIHVNQPSDASAVAQDVADGNDRPDSVVAPSIQRRL
jgi:hypothetical protein